MPSYQHDLLLSDRRIKRVHVNQWCLSRSMRTEADEPCITAKVGRDNHYGREIRLLDRSRVRQSMWKPMSCGARIWLETKGPIHVLQTADEAFAHETRVHISTCAIRDNLKREADDPCVTVVTPNGTFQARDVEIDGPSRVIQILSRSGTIRIETDAPVLFPDTLQIPLLATA